MSASISDHLWPAPSYDPIAPALATSPDADLPPIFDVREAYAPSGSGASNLFDNVGPPPVRPSPYSNPISTKRAVPATAAPQRQASAYSLPNLTPAPAHPSLAPRERTLAPGADIDDSSMLFFSPFPVNMARLQEHLRKYGTIQWTRYANSPFTILVTLPSPAAVEEVLSHGCFYLDSVPIGVMRNDGKGTASADAAAVPPRPAAPAAAQPFPQYAHPSSSAPRSASARSSVIPPRPASPTHPSIASPVAEIETADREKASLFKDGSRGAGSAGGITSTVSSWFPSVFSRDSAVDLFSPPTHHVNSGSRNGFAAPSEPAGGASSGLMNTVMEFFSW
ncbi:hypothetical protein H9P43_001104 [Blastocladiella emersonii ATCC 22665]|nr:hypothetical protein H9P43_001104 [Blastocladiella emersonii ATCC 22665]